MNICFFNSEKLIINSFSASSYIRNTNRYGDEKKNLP
jgi:hypothetical protein